MASSPQFPLRLPDLPSLQLECVPLEEDDFLFPRPEGDLATPASLGEAIREARIGQHWMGQHLQAWGVTFFRPHINLSLASTGDIGFPPKQGGQEAKIYSVPQCPG